MEATSLMHAGLGAGSAAAAAVAASLPDFGGLDGVGFGNHSAMGGPTSSGLFGLDAFGGSGSSAASLGVHNNYGYHHTYHHQVRYIHFTVAIMCILVRDLRVICFKHNAEIK